MKVTVTIAGSTEWQLATALAALQRGEAVLREYGLEVPFAVAQEMKLLRMELAERAADAKALKLKRLEGRIAALKQDINPEQVLEELQEELRALQATNGPTA